MFDGSLANWPKFQDLMSQSEDTEALQLCHLNLDKGLVGAAAAADILNANIINEGNYQHVRNTVMDLSENRRVILETHICGLLSLKKMSKSTIGQPLSAATGHV